MDSNKNRQSNSQYGEGEYGINAGRGCLVWLLALAAAAFLIANLPV